MKLRLGKHLVYFGLASMLFTSCGQGPSFLNREESSGKGANAQSQGSSADVLSAATSDVNGDGVVDANDVIGPDGKLPDGTVATTNPTTDAPPADPTGTGGAGSTTAGDPAAPVYPTVPGASTDDVIVLNKCMEKWKTLPWTGTVPNFRKIYAAVNIGGSGVTINETTRTAQPELVLIYAGVNVGGSTSWNLMNPNAYYCMKVNVNVQTQFAINLHCNARLSDNSVQVNVGGTTTSSTSTVGVNVLSTVNVNNITPAGDQCIR